MAEENDNPPRFRKTKTGKWAVMGPIDVLEKALAEGGKVDVQRKSGDWSTFQVASLGRPFDVDGVQMCYGYGPDDEEGDGPAERGDAGGGAERRPVSATRSGAASAPARPPRRSSYAEAPPADPSEPLPEYRGGPEDEWEGF